MLEIGTKILILLLVFVVGFFVGKKHGVNLERAIQKAKEAEAEFHGKKEG